MPELRTGRGSDMLRDILPAQRDASGDQRLQAGQAVDQLRLSVAVDTGDTDDLAFRTLKADILDRVVVVPLGGDGHALLIQDRLRPASHPSLSTTS